MHHFGMIPQKFPTKHISYLKVINIHSSMHLTQPVACQMCDDSVYSNETYEAISKNYDHDIYDNVNDICEYNGIY